MTNGPNDRFVRSGIPIGRHRTPAFFAFSRAKDAPINVAIALRSESVDDGKWDLFELLESSRFSACGANLRRPLQ